MPEPTREAPPEPGLPARPRRLEGGDRRGENGRPRLQGPLARRQGPGAPVAELLRGPHPFDRQTFEALATEAQRLGQERPGEPASMALETYARGGQAYLEGDEKAALEALGSLAEATRRDQLPPMLTLAGPLWVLRDRDSRADFAPWEVAVAYGDGRDLGRPAVTSWLASHPDDLRAAFARAFLERLHGSHSSALEQATALYPQLSAREPARAVDLARFLGAECAALGRYREALGWWQKAAAAGGKPGLAAALEGARIAEEELGDRAAALELLEVACRGGNPPACRRAQLLKSRG